MWCCSLDLNCVLYTLAQKGMVFKLSCFENWSYKIFSIGVQFDIDLPFFLRM